MTYDNNPMNDRGNNVRTNQTRNESEDQRTRRQNRIGLVILCLAVLAFVGGFAATMDKRQVGTTETPATTATTASNTPATGSNEAAIAPAAGNPTTPTSSSGDMTGTAVNSTPEATGTDMAATATTASTTPSATQPVTENPKVYTSEESCRGSVNGACQPISGGWTPVNPSPEKTAVPEAVAPAMTATSPSDSNED